MRMSFCRLAFDSAMRAAISSACRGGSNTATVPALRRGDAHNLTRPASQRHGAHVGCMREGHFRTHQDAESGVRPQNRNIRLKRRTAGIRAAQPMSPGWCQLAGLRSQRAVRCVMACCVLSCQHVLWCKHLSHQMLTVMETSWLMLSTTLR